MMTTMTKAGTVYKYIASDALKEMGFSREERVALSATEDFESLEAVAGAKCYVEAGCAALREELERLEIYPPQDFVDVLLWSDHPLDELMSLRRSILVGGDDPGYIPDGTVHFGKFPEDKKGVIAYRFLQAVHDEWVLDRDHEPMYFDMAQENKRYRFLPAPLIGFEELMRFSIYMDPVLVALCIPSSRQYIRQAYTEARRRYAECYNIKDQETLKLHIRHIDYAPLSQAMRISMEYPRVAECIAGQVVDQNGNPRVW